VDAFPTNAQAQIRLQLSFVLEGILSQQLLPKKNGKGRVAALEIMRPTTAIRNLIREDKISQIYGSMQVGQSETGSQTLNQSLAQLVITGKVAEKSALARSQDPRELSKILEESSGQRKSRSNFRGR
jgi:twitching motility protein PilT